MTPETRQPKHDTTHITDVHLIFPIESMTVDEKLGLLSQFLSLEHKYLRAPHNLPQIRPEGKIDFIVAYDVTQAKDFNDNFIHTRYRDKAKEAAPKFGEGLEAISAISRYFEDFQERKNLGLPPPNKANVINEITDVVYCLGNLMTLDGTYREQYKLYIHEIASSMGLSLDELLTFTIFKYNFRLGHGKSQKDHMAEDIMFQEVLNQKKPDGSPMYHIPTNDELRMTFQKMTNIIDLLWGRKKTLKTLHEWNITPRT
jgi:hypothetical protein